MFLPSCMLEAAEPQPPFGPPNPQIWIKSKPKRFKPDQVDDWEGELQCLFNKICLTTAPEVHGAQVLPDPDYVCKHVICPK